MPTNIDPSTATPITGVTTTDYTSSGSFSNAGYSRSADGDAATWPQLFRHAWFSYEPSADGTLSFNCRSSTPASGGYVEARFYEHNPDNSLTFLARVVNSTGTDQTASVVSGSTYLLVIESNVDAGATYNWQVVGPPEVGSGPGDTPLPVPAITASVAVDSTGGNLPDPRPDPVQVGVQVRGRITGEVDIVEVVPVTVSVALPSAVEVDYVEAIGVGVRLGAPLLVEAGLIMTQPEDGEVVATATPQFIVALDQRDEDVDYTIEIQYDDNDAFTDPVTISSLVDGTAGGLFITPEQPVPAHAYWRVRLLLDGVEQIGWSQPQSFTVDATVSTAVLPVTWNVDPAAERPIHLWHFDPPDPDVGDVITAYGQGFPLSPGRVTVADVPMDIQSWTLVPASPESEPVIDGGVVDPEHFEVAFLVPDVPGGGPCTVEP